MRPARTLIRRGGALTRKSALGASEARPDSPRLPIERAFFDPYSIRYFNAAANLRATLRAGVTTVRDAGSADAGIKLAVERGLVPGPRVLTAIGVISQTGGHIGDNWLASGVLWPEQPGQPSTVVDGCDSARRVVRQLVMSGARSGSVRGSRLRSSGFGRDGPSSDEGSRRPVHVRVRGSNPLRLHYTYSTLGLGRRAFGVTSRGATSQSGVLIGYSPGPRCVLAVVACARLVVGRELRTEEESSSRASSSGSGTDGRLRRGASVKVGDSLAGLPEAGITSKDDRLAAFGQVELRQDHGDVVGDRLGREEQCLSDLDVGEACGEFVEDQPLTVGELEGTTWRSWLGCRRRRYAADGRAPCRIRPARPRRNAPRPVCPRRRRP